MPTRRERRNKRLNPKKEGYKTKPWQKGRDKEEREARNKKVFKSPEEKEAARREIERMGLDCVVGIKLLEEGVPMKELKFLAIGNANIFLERNGKKLPKKYWRYIWEKYK